MPPLRPRSRQVRAPSPVPMAPAAAGADERQRSAWARRFAGGRGSRRRLPRSQSSWRRVLDQRAPLGPRQSLPRRSEPVGMAWRPPRRCRRLPFGLQKALRLQAKEKRVERAGLNPGERSQLIAMAPPLARLQQRRQQGAARLGQSAISSHADNSTYVELFVKGLSERNAAGENRAWFGHDGGIGPDVPAPVAQKLCEALGRCLTDRQPRTPAPYLRLQAGTTTSIAHSATSTTAGVRASTSPSIEMGWRGLVSIRKRRPWNSCIGACR